MTCPDCNGTGWINDIYGSYPCCDIEEESMTQEEKQAAMDMFTTSDTTQLLRTFESGATRSPLGDKLQYEGFLSPLVLQRFAQYMHHHRTQSDGQIRDADNWQKGIPPASLMDSATRHFWDWWLYHRGHADRAMEPIEEALCALMFNCMAYLKHILEEEK